MIGLEVEKALSSSNAIRKSGTTHEFQVIVNDLKSESWVAENANKRAALHQASLGVATCLDCCTVDVLCGPGLDAVSVGLESFREHDRFQVVRIKNLFCPSNLEVQRFRRLLVSLRVFDIEESLTAKQAKSPSKSHVVEVTLHLKDIFDAYTTQPMLFKVRHHVKPVLFVFSNDHMLLRYFVNRIHSFIFHASLGMKSGMSTLGKHGLLLVIGLKF